jgi:CheY-like chemotaxis protein
MNDAMKLGKILVVDDEKDIREALAEAFRHSGYTVFEAEDGMEALETAFKEKPDIIFLDIMMPNMNGHQTLHELRKDPWGRTVKVVFLSALEDATNIATAFDQGGEEYLIKTNWSLEELIKKAEQCLLG